MQALFSQVLYSAKLEDPTLETEVQDIINNRELQKNLLATGDLRHIIQEMLDLVVTNGRLHDRAAVRHESDLKSTAYFF